MLICNPTASSGQHLSRSTPAGTWLSACPPSPYCSATPRIKQGYARVQSAPRAPWQGSPGIARRNTASGSRISTVPLGPSRIKRKTPLKRSLAWIEFRPAINSLHSCLRMARRIGVCGTGDPRLNGTLPPVFEQFASHVSADDGILFVSPHQPPQRVGDDDPRPRQQLPRHATPFAPAERPLQARVRPPE